LLKSDILRAAQTTELSLFDETLIFLFGIWVLFFSYKAFTEFLKVDFRIFYGNFFITYKLPLLIGYICLEPIVLSNIFFILMCFCKIFSFLLWNIEFFSIYLKDFSFSLITKIFQKTSYLSFIVFKCLHIHKRTWWDSGKFEVFLLSKFFFDIEYFYFKKSHTFKILEKDSKIYLNRALFYHLIYYNILFSKIKILYIFSKNRGVQVFFWHSVY
jgi:hypothetical protein